MSMTLTLDPELGARLEHQARRLGIPAADYAAQLLEQAARAGEEAGKAAAIAELRSWVEEGDEEEQRNTFEAIRSGLNANHSSDRIIFP